MAVRMIRKPTKQFRLYRHLLFLLPLFLFLLFNFSLVYAASGGHGGEAAGGHGAAGGESSARIMDLILRSVNFIIFLVVLVFLVRKPLKQGLAGRRENIQKELDELEQKKEDAKRELQNFETRLGALKEERDSILKEFKKEGEREKAKIIEGAQKTASRIVEQAQLTIQQEIQKSNQALREEVAELSVKMAEDILRKNITDNDQKVLIGEYLAKVVTH
jgi:F-type H+-transporting ATPase subunit b